MEKYFFDCRTNGNVVVDEEGREFSDVVAAHIEALSSLADAIRDATEVVEASDQHIAVEVRDVHGPVLEVSVLFRSKILRQN